MSPSHDGAAATASEDGSSWRGGATLAARVVDSYPYGIVVVRRDGQVLACNRAAERLLGELDGPAQHRFRRLLGYGEEDSGIDGLSLIERAIEDRALLGEVRVDLGDGAAVPAAWVTVAPLNAVADSVTVQLRPGDANDRRWRTTPDWTGVVQVRIQALGRTRVAGAEGPIGGPWLANRAGEILKFLVAQRRRAVSPAEIVDVVFEHARLPDAPGVRYYVHELRNRLEPDRRHGESSIIARVHGGYMLRRESVVIDADEFERHVKTGLLAADAGDEERACAELERGLRLYDGDFLADEPYAEWAIPERERLRRVAADALRALTELRLARNDLEAATAALDQLAELEPYDVEVHKRLIALAVQRGRRTEAVRRYDALRHRTMATFREALDFTLADVLAA